MNDEKKTEDPLVEIRRFRDEHAKRFKYDIKAIFEDIKRFEKEKNLKTVSLPIKRAEKTGS